MRFKDKVAIVTGGASGIGAATVRALGKEGAKVLVADINLFGFRYSDFGFFNAPIAFRLHRVGGFNGD